MHLHPIPHNNNEEFCGLASVTKKKMIKVDHSPLGLAPPKCTDIAPTCNYKFTSNLCITLFFSLRQAFWSLVMLKRLCRPTKEKLLLSMEFLWFRLISSLSASNLASFLIHSLFFWQKHLGHRTLPLGK